MDETGAMKLYKPSLTQCLYVALAENMVGRVPLALLFLAIAQLRQSLTCSASARYQASRLNAPMQQLLPEDGAAMFMRLTCGCGSLGSQALPGRADSGAD
jgi:hypothetical protein